jgi:glutamyl-tRNA synthetase
VTEPVRTRIEPAPSGSIHVGNARTALFNWLFARHCGGTFVLRIADTDAKRVTEENYRAVLDDMRWLGLDWDEGPEVGGPSGPYRQSERFDVYRDWAAKLVEGGFAYYDYATPDDIDAERKRARTEGRKPDHYGISQLRRNEGRAPSVRLLVPEERTITWHDEVLGEMNTNLGVTPDFVILRSDGTPTYMLAVTADDFLMKITHVVRGNDLVASTARQILIREAMRIQEIPKFAHLPLLVSPDGKPLSKRWGDVAVSAYREQGFLPEAMVNYLSLLGWSYDDRTNIFTRAELIERFSLDRVAKNPATFDMDKLEWINGHYIRELTPERLAADLVPFCESAGFNADSIEGRRNLARVSPLLAERMKRLTDAPPMIRFLFEDVAPDAKAVKALEGQGEYLRTVAARLDIVEKWTSEAIEGALRALAEELELKPRKAFQPIRAAVTGTLVSPPLFESLEILGRKVTIERLLRDSH